MEKQAWHIQRGFHQDFTQLGIGSARRILVGKLLQCIHKLSVYRYARWGYRAYSLGSSFVGRRPQLGAGSATTDNFGMVRQEKLSRIEGESPSRLNMHDNTKT